MHSACIRSPSDNAIFFYKENKFTFPAFRNLERNNYLTNKFSLLEAVAHRESALVCRLHRELDKHAVAINSVRLSIFPIDVIHVQKSLGVAPHVIAIVASVRT
jgi:hypothetical protein